MDTSHNQLKNGKEPSRPRLVELEYLRNLWELSLRYQPADGRDPVRNLVNAEAP